jgi:hypothetical protein
MRCMRLVKGRRCLNEVKPVWFVYGGVISKSQVCGKHRSKGFTFYKTLHEAQLAQLESLL